MLRGNHPARIDEKGRLKIPAEFRAAIEAQWGSELFATTIRGDSMTLYPMPVWIEIERRAAEAPDFPRLHLLRLNSFGQVVRLDKQGRIVVPQALRERAALTAEVSVLGLHTQLQVWNRQRLEDRLFKEQPLTDEDEKALSRHGIF
jgi:MraZ protein